MPRAKPVMLQGPHQAVQTVSCELATTVVECPTPLSKTRSQSAPDWMPNPWVFCHTYWPPAIQWSGFASSASNGAMNRGFGSWGSMSRIARTVPSDRPQVSVTCIAR